MKRRGLSLLEVILALAILALSMAAIGELIRIGTRSARGAEDFTRGQILCESKLSEIISGVQTADPVTRIPFANRSRLVLHLRARGHRRDRSLMALTVTVETHIERPRPLSYSLVRWIPDPGIELPEEPEETEEPANRNGRRDGDDDDDNRRGKWPATATIDEPEIPNLQRRRFGEPAKRGRPVDQAPRIAGQSPRRHAAGIDPRAGARRDRAGGDRLGDSLAHAGFDTRRTDVEKAQLARAVLKIIADDLRSVVAHNAVDLTDAARLRGGRVRAWTLEKGRNGGDEGGDGGEGVRDESARSLTETEERRAERYLLRPDARHDPGHLRQSVSIADRCQPPAADRRFRPWRRDRRRLTSPSDVKTVAYYLQPDLGPAAEDETASARRFRRSGKPRRLHRSAAAHGWGRGLVRRALDRSATQWALENGDTARLDRTAKCWRWKSSRWSFATSMARRGS